jgi:hypothetical protein
MGLYCDDAGGKSAGGRGNPESLYRRACPAHGSPSSSLSLSISASFPIQCQTLGFSSYPGYEANGTEIQSLLPSLLPSGAGSRSLAVERPAMSSDSAREPQFYSLSATIDFLLNFTGALVVSRRFNYAAFTVMIWDLILTFPKEVRKNAAYWR